MKFAKVLRTQVFFIEHLLVAASVLCKDFVDIIYEGSHTHTRRRLYVVAA